MGILTSVSSVEGFHGERRADAEASNRQAVSRRRRKTRVLVPSHLGARRRAVRARQRAERRRHRRARGRCRCRAERSWQRRRQSSSPRSRSPVPSNPGHVPALDAPKVEIAVDLDPADLVSATPPPARSPLPSSHRRARKPQAPFARPYTPPRPPPEPVVMRDAGGTGDFVPVKKSNTGLIIGAVAVLAIVGGVIGVKVMGGDKTASANKTSTSQTSPVTKRRRTSRRLPKSPRRKSKRSAAARTNAGAARRDRREDERRADRERVSDDARRRTRTRRPRRT